MPKIVVLGGSFNPPTVAHERLMRAAIDAVGAKLGIFVPTSFTYVQKKMKRARQMPDTLSDELRLAMLESICAGHRDMTVNLLQMERPELLYNYETLCELQKAYPEDELCMVTGSDKLNVLSRWHRSEELLRDFRLLIAARGDDDLESVRADVPALAAYWDGFTFFQPPENIADVSSSAFRTLLHAGDESARGLVTEGVWRILDEAGKIPWRRIDDFHAEAYAFLSNFYEAPVALDGLVYGCAEAAFQAQKCLSREEMLPFTQARPAESKKLGRRVQLRPDWEEVKTGLMERVVRAKFTQNAELAAMLLATGDKTLVEGNRWHDTCWGVDMNTGQGENRLGKILMKVREELRLQS